MLRQAEAGEEFTVTASGPPVARLGPAHPRQWVAGPALARIWDTPAPERLAEDLAAFPGALSDPFRAMRALLDTSVSSVAGPREIEGAISAASLAELCFGVLVASGEGERARRVRRLGVIEATFDPPPLDAEVCPEWGRPSAAVASRGGRPRRRPIDLAIAATADVHRGPRHPRPQ